MYFDRKSIASALQTAVRDLALVRVDGITRIASIAHEFQAFGFSDVARRCRAHGHPIPDRDKPALGIKTNTPFTWEALAALTEAGRVRPVDSYTLTILRLFGLLSNESALARHREIAAGRPEQRELRLVARTWRRACDPCPTAKALSSTGVADEVPPALPLANCNVEGCACRWRSRRRGGKVKSGALTSNTGADLAVDVARLQ